MASINISKTGLLVFVLLAACTGKPCAAGNAPSGMRRPPRQRGDRDAIRTLKDGTGAAVAAGKIAVVEYTGWLYEASATDNKGKQFDSSRTAGRAVRFPLGAGSVIKGWDQGVAGMKIGESRRLIIPADLGLWRQRCRRRHSARRDPGVRYRSHRH